MMELKSIDLNSLLKLGIAIDYEPGYAEGQRRAIELYGCPLIVVNRTTMHLLTNRSDLLVLKSLRDSGAPQPRHIHNWQLPVILADWPAEVEKQVAIRINGGINGHLLARPYLDSVEPVLLNYTPDNWEDAAAIGLDPDDLLYLLDAISSDEQPVLIQDEPPVDESWGIPALDPTLQGHAITRAVKYGTQARSERIPGATYHFYTDDRKFRSLIDNPQPVIDSACESVIEPNFSIDQDSPRVIALYQIYHKRRLARIWQQEARIRVFVDMNVPPSSFDLNLLGVPPGWTAYANRAYAQDLDHLMKAYRAAQNRAATDTILYVVYGGGTKAKALCEAHGWHWIPDHTHTIHEVNNGQR